MFKCNCFGLCQAPNKEEEPLTKESSEIHSPVDYGTVTEDKVDASSGEQSTKTNSKKEKPKKSANKKQEDEGTEKEWSKSLEFKKFDIEEFDRVFSDFASALNPFVENREKLEKAQAAFKRAVESYCAVSPQASFKDYVDALKTKLKEEGIFIKIKEGAVRIYHEGEKVVKAVLDAVAAIKQILATGKALLRMPETVATASQNSLEDLENLDVGEIISRRLSVSVFDCGKVVKVKTALSANVKKLKNAPKMVGDFRIQVKIILVEIKAAFSEKEDEEDVDKDKDESSEEEQQNGKGKEEGGTERQDDEEADKSGEEGQSKTKIEERQKASGKEKSKNENENRKMTKEENGSKGTKQEKSKDEKGTRSKETNGSKEDKKTDKKDDFHKKLQIETIGLPDVDRLFSDLASATNRFIITREKLQTAREAFVKIMKTIIEFDGEREVKAYVKELRDKAKEGKITIYLDTRDGHVRVTSIKGVDPPAPYRDAVKALNSLKEAGSETVDLEPTVQRALQACIRDIMDIDPARDFKKMVSGLKAAMTLPKKLKTFNDNRKKVQQAPEIVKEFCLYVKQLLCDIVEAFKEDQDETNDGGEEDDGMGETKESGEEDDGKGETKNGEEDDGKNTIKADVHTAGSHGNGSQAGKANAAVC